MRLCECAHVRTCARACTTCVVDFARSPLCVLFCAGIFGRHLCVLPWSKCVPSVVSHLTSHGGGAQVCRSWSCAPSFSAASCFGRVSSVMRLPKRVVFAIPRSYRSRVHRGSDSSSGHVTQHDGLWSQRLRHMYRVCVAYGMLSRAQGGMGTCLAFRDGACLVDAAIVRTPWHSIVSSVRVVRGLGYDSKNPCHCCFQ